ncbi:NAD operon protein [Salinarchaeum sp. Harcht-Bsk1]|uniref:SAM hydrolase/SAM-dependent halogenase family protein n=1 Tax=Salinarchaeum sp. Harcht-Bsk1 TaxID=1333523 RepID=UPI0003422C68|nr:SAM-dependent chlorinase/fluorinase [Salinarchaeum sp. Harcht-Bsk1]AGN00326.1 NAD operon protein [Salinarchaeum sp. Harcht-Bsk1]
MLTLASDFGSPYPAAMRAAVRQYSDCEILDVAHDFPRQDVRTAAFWLREVLPYAPAPAVHCAVVDPGVGSDRAAVALRVGEHALIAPDNGLVVPAARRLRERMPAAGSGLRGVDPSPDGDEISAVAEPAAIEAFEIAVDDPASSTFHGRDVFAPAAALIHERGVASMETCSFLDPVDEFVDLQFPVPIERGDGADGEVLVVDGFGNAITNVPGDLLDGRDRIRVDGTAWPVADHYAAVDVGDGLVTVGSHGNVELAVNRGRGADRFEVGVGDDVAIRFS